MAHDVEVMCFSCGAAGSYDYRLSRAPVGWHRLDLSGVRHACSQSCADKAYVVAHVSKLTGRSIEQLIADRIGADHWSADVVRAYRETGAFGVSMFETAAKRKEAPRRSWLARLWPFLAAAALGGLALSAGCGSVPEAARRLVEVQRQGVHLQRKYSVPSTSLNELEWERWHRTWDELETNLDELERAVGN